MSDQIDRPEDMDELLGAYALDAVDGPEREAVERHLDANPAARAEVAEHQEVASMLTYGGAAAPEGLWDRIAAAIEGTAPPPGPELAKVMPVTAQTRRRRILLTVAAAAAAAVIALVVGVLVGRNTSSTKVADPVRAAYEQALADPASKRIELASEDGKLHAQAVVAPSGRGFVAADSLPELATDRTYQLWVITPDGTKISLGVLGNRPAVSPFTMNTTAAALAVSTEAKAGSAQPTQVALVGMVT
jgi:anti-sigma-K factor RskA